ncbi:hypothetical protein F5884DRAFT_847287 [Xylogone sp. PMI_703]|nr:hypothetical protein F5884DRAFT_847287 [Xylogone sp. PMI_703]
MATGEQLTWQRLPPYEQVPESKCELDWAELVTLDLSRFDLPDGKQQLAEQAKDAIHRIGFFYVTNFGLSQEEVDRQYAIGKALFELSTNEKLQYIANLDQGEYIGYKPAGLREVVPGIGENTEVYNVPKFIADYKRNHPAIIQKNLSEIERFSKHVHYQIVNKLFALFAIIMELPENYFIDRHLYTNKSSCYLRYMKYHAYTPEENAAVDNIWLRGHTDFGSLTLLFRQPVAGLQVRTPDGSWKYVKPFKESITVNVADTLQFLSNNFLKSSIHRVVTPPEDQSNKDRLGVIYFVRPGDDIRLEAAQSPLLERMGLQSNGSSEPLGNITAADWVKARTMKNINKVEAATGKSDIDTVGGVKTEFYFD